MAAICVDAGTTMIKAVGYDDRGTETVVVRRPTVVDRRRPGWAEQDMAAVRDAAFDAVRDVARQLDRPVGFLAVTAQGDGCWLVDDAAVPTGPAILWHDARAATVVRDWAQRGVLAEAFPDNGSVVSTGLPNAILTWLRAHDPDRVEASAAALTCGGWLFAQLTGVLLAEESDAAAPFVDLRTGAYSDRLLELFDLRWARRLLPPIVGDGQRIAALRADVADGLGLPAGTPVVAAPYDIASTALGVGAVRPGQACSILGTTLCTEIVTDDAGGVVANAAAPVGLTITLGAPGRHLRAMPTLAGTEVLTWACRLLQLDHPTDLARLAARASASDDGVIFLPYLSPAGERAPFLDPDASGTLLGVTVEHGPEHIARAVYEGLCMAIRDCLTATGVTPTELLVCGGGAANPYWTQLIADTTGVPVIRAADDETGARGAYIIGAAAIGCGTVEGLIDAHVRARDAFEPSPAASDRAEGRFATFVAARTHLTGLWPHLADRGPR